MNEGSPEPQISLTDLLTDLRRRFPASEVALFDRNTGVCEEVPLFVRHHFPDVIGATEKIHDAVAPESQADLDLSIRRASLLVSAQTTITLATGRSVVCHLVKIPELGGILGVFADPETTGLQVFAEHAEQLTSVGRAQLDSRGEILWLSEGMASLLPPITKPVGANLFDHIEPEIGQRVKQALIDVEENKDRIVRMAVRRTHHGIDEDLRMEISLNPVDHTISLHINALDQSDLDRLSAQRTDREFRALAERLRIGVFVLDRFGPMKFANEALYEIVGVDALKGFSWIDVIHHDDIGKLEALVGRLRVTPHAEVTLRVITSNDEVRWCKITCQDMRSEDGSVEGIVGLAEDVTELRSLHDRLARETSTDNLTSLPNRAMLFAHLEEILNEQRLRPGWTAVLLIDLDRLKLINDTQGHAIGDEILQAAAERFNETIRPGDVLSRFGGDEFVVVAAGVQSPDVAMRIARRMHEALEVALEINGQRLRMTASIGVALSRGGAERADELLGDADLAMYEAKRKGRCQTVVYDTGLRRAASQRFDIITDLRHARSRREFRLEYQPIYELETSGAVGCEALIRWDHPVHGRLMPNSFISLAEESGLIIDLGDWVIEQACSDLARLRSTGAANESFFMTINVSSMQLSQLNDLAKTAIHALEVNGLRPKDLVFEITESIPVDAIPDAIQQIRQLRDLGFRLAIDDFGTGYSSLEYLTMLPFNVMKIDPSLTASLQTNLASQAVIESIAGVAERLGFEIIAEGIEDSMQEQALRDAGVKLGQGYLRARPVPLEALPPLLT